MNRRTRSVLIWAHRWFGLTLGVIFVVISVSGSLLLFQPQFFQWVHGDMLPENLSAETGSIDRWAQNARAAVPDELVGPTYIWRPHVEHNESDAGMLLFEGLEPDGLGRMGLLAVLVAPDTGEVLGTVDVDHSLAYAPIFLHRDLWAGEAGEILVGIMAVGAAVMLPAGLWLWWPSRGRLRRKLSPKPWRITFARAAGLHDWIGAWTIVVLVPLVATGLYLVQPGWVEPLLGTVPDSPEADANPQAAVPCTGAMSLDTAIERAGERVPNGEFTGMMLDDGVWEIAFVTRGSASTVDETHVIADLGCGTVAVEATPDSRPPRESLEAWLVDLHTGAAFGLPGELLVTLVGFAPLVLAWSGIRMWFRRRGWLAAPARKRYAMPAAVDE